MQLFGEGVTDVAQALDRHAQAFEIVAAQARHRGGADTGEYAHGGMGRRSPAAVVLVTKLVCWAMQSMSATEVPLSMAVI